MLHIDNQRRILKMKRATTTTSSNERFICYQSTECMLHACTFHASQVRSTSTKNWIINLWNMCFPRRILRTFKTFCCLHLPLTQLFQFNEISMLNLHGTLTLTHESQIVCAINRIINLFDCWLLAKCVNHTQRIKFNGKFLANDCTYASLWNCLFLSPLAFFGSVHADIVKSKTTFSPHQMVNVI